MTCSLVVSNRKRQSTFQRSLYLQVELIIKSLSLRRSLCSFGTSLPGCRSYDNGTMCRILEHPRTDEDSTTSCTALRLNAALHQTVKSFNNFFATLSPKPDNP